MIWRCAAGRAAKVRLRASRGVLPARWYSSAVRSRESVSVACRSNGAVTVDIQLPLTKPSNQDAIPNLLIYLPRGPLLSNEEHDAATLATLAQRLPTHHIVRLNYRLSPTHQYPTPVHDVLAGYDWVLENLLPKRAISRPGRADQVGRVAVCGELIGGALAAMLGLTECRAAEAGVGFVALRAPIVDWVALDATARDDGKGGVGGVVDELIKLRGKLFPKPGMSFDPFASPLLFFRTPGVDVPAAPPPEVDLDDLALLSLHEREEHAQQHASGTGPADSNASENDVPAPAPLARRKTSRRFPSPALNLRLPDFRISSPPLTPLTQQAKELTHVLRQSFVRQAKQRTSGSSFGRKVLLEDEVDEEDQAERWLRERLEADARAKVEFVRDKAVGRGMEMGLWGDGPEGVERVAELARWVGERMG